MTRWLTEWLPRIVARAPVTIHTKLLAAFLSIVLLLIMVGAVSLEVLSGVNRRVQELVTLQRKIAAYRQLHHDTTSQLYSVTSALLVPDILHGIIGNPDLMSDAIHPNDRGYAIVADRLEPALQSFLSESDPWWRRIVRVELPSNGGRESKRRATHDPT